MWEKLLELGEPLNMPWLILGDFNCVKSAEEKQLGVAPTWYELKDFVDCCLALELHDAPTTGCFYTWYSNNEGNPVWCKLDRVLLNNEWLEAGLHCGAHFSSPGCLSDHSPGIVSLFDPPTPKPKPFRFFNMWADHPDFLATVENGWNMNVEGTPQFSLCRKLKALKGPLKTFNNLHYSHISARAKEADLALQEAQRQLESDPENAVIRGSLGDLRSKAVFLAETERQFYYQKAKIHFLKLGDRNTKFYHDMVKRNAARSSILAITKSDGTIVTSAADIGQEFVAYYTSLLGTEAQTLPVDNDVFEWGPKLSPEHALELCRTVTPLEVKEAIFHISDSKALDPDGFSACFFKRAWNVVGDQVSTAVLDFFRSGRLLRQLNHAIITLVPKSEHCPSVTDYRPISCCNVVYKAITKIIADQLAPTLEHLIDRCQAAFVGGRNITDNIFLAQEMVRQYTRKRISPRCTINVDLRKAFDSVSWGFLSQVLHGYGFPPLFIS
ncbi:UNVERIFIED_CONTAM: Retrovirus-related Pol polyprotein from type-2 retrotransposable element R2DM [Sesamum radiatum]|uniref:Retrovirus-related Pol polyprotein from type-2 retrotransposable element R2DM n=1 Tax=Sesamum radiatum TaxID=300843 RepID=A0AAW2TUJ9_SESRA